jgi:MtfA peptidase
MPVVDSVYNTELDIFLKFDEEDKLLNLQQLCNKYAAKTAKDTSIDYITCFRVGKIVAINLETCQHQYVTIETHDAEKEKYDKLGDYIIIAISVFIIALIPKFIQWAKRQKIADNPNNIWLPYVTFDDRGRRNSQTKTYLTYMPFDLRFEKGFVETLLEKHIPFYTNLNTNNRKIFVRRVNYFMQLRVYNVHHAYGNKEMPILIAANAVTISFKMAHYRLRHFSIVNVFVDEFTEIGKPNNLKGLVKNKSINFSWKHFVEGQNNTKDGINLGLHELAHAYYADNILLNKWRNNSFTRHYPDFEKLAYKYISKQKLDLSGMYSETALNNIDEFFAESVELFFEKQSELKVKHREVFLQLGLVLNQQEA